MITAFIRHLCFSSIKDLAGLVSLAGIRRRVVDDWDLYGSLFQSVTAFQAVEQLQSSQTGRFEHFPRTVPAFPLMFQHICTA